MYYPLLDAPGLTAPMLIAIIALLHVFVSHYAVGGGLLLARENSRALKKEDAAYRAYWKKHAKFFILLTVPYGAITGVGIWYAIGLASPLATETLIRTFVFGWAIEWCFFFLEVVSGFALYYFWDRFGRRASSFAGWIYALSAWISLVLITGITSFMLNSSGLIEDWESTGNFWHAFLNVQFLPQTVARTGCALTLGSLYVLAHASFAEKNADVREQVVKRMRLPAFTGLVLLAAGVAGWAYFLPESGRLTLERAAATNIFAGLFVAVLAGIALLLIIGPCLRPRETSFAGALAMLLMGIAGVAVAEFVREAVRKPYVVDRVVYGHQVNRADVARLRQTGLLYNGIWTRKVLEELQEEYADSGLKISAEAWLGWEPEKLELPEGWGAPAEVPADEPAPESDALPEEETEQPAPAEDLLGDASRRFVLQTVSLQQYPDSGAGRFTPTSTSGVNPAANPVGAPNSGLYATPQTPLAPAPTAQNGASAAAPAPNANSAWSAATAQPAAAGTLQSAPPQNTLQNTAPAPAMNVAQPSAQNPAPAAAPVRNPGVRPTSAQDETTGLDAGVPGLVGDPEPLAEEDAKQTEEAEPAKTPAEMDLEINGPIARGNEDLLQLEEKDRKKLGRVVFLYHCNSCHAEDHGYSAMAPMIAGKGAEEIAGFALTLNHSHFYMPPWSGTEVEAELLGEYLESISPKTPANVFQKDKPVKAKKAKQTEPAEEEEGADSAEIGAEAEPAETL